MHAVRCMVAKYKYIYIYINIVIYYLYINICVYIYKLIGEGWANAAFSLYWGMCPGVHMAGQKLDTPLHG